MLEREVAGESLISVERKQYLLRKDKLQSDLQSRDHFRSVRFGRSTNLRRIRVCAPTGTVGTGKYHKFLGP